MTNDTVLNRRQLTDTVIMIPPDQFGYNPQTAPTNRIMTDEAKQKGLDPQIIRDQAVREFNGMVAKLREADIEVLILDNRPGEITPDAVFPNNWFSHHVDGQLIIYPMLVPNRRAERQVENLKVLLADAQFRKPEIHDLSELENEDLILEGTGSLVLDRVNKVAYAMESERTTEETFRRWISNMDYEGFFFHAFDKDNLPFYHTNVVMSIGAGFAVACPAAIKDEEERALFVEKLRENDRELIRISLEQVREFCGNILHVNSTSGKQKIIMSEKAFKAFSTEQLAALDKFGDLIAVDITTIETNGGGSARCMLAEVFA